MILDQYGDLRPVERHYPAMKKWVKYMEGFLQNGIMPKNTYGDWCVPPEKPELIHSKDPARVTAGPLLSTAYYHQVLGVMSRFARLTGRSADAAEFDALAARIREAFLTRWFNPQENRFDNGTQTSSVLPLAFNLVPEDRRAAVFGRPDVAFTIATQTTYPGWGYMIGKGATTIWKLWNGDTADPAMNSGNHVMQIGDLGVWLYEYIAGIRAVPAKPGFKQIVVKPYPVAGLTHARATHRSPYGLISSAWRREGGRFTLEVSIPPNTAATVDVPSKQPSSVSEAGGLKPAGSEAARACLKPGRVVIPELCTAPDGLLTR
jgi:alpha-L-rhamnosidase